MGEKSRQRAKELMQSLYDKAKKNKMHLILPEGDDLRIIKAASMATSKNIAKITLIGDKDKIKKLADNEKISLEGIEIADPKNHPSTKEYEDEYLRLRAHKGVNPEKAAKDILHPLLFAAMMVHSKDADGYVSGAVYSTGDTLRPALQILKCAPGISKVFSYFMMVVDDPSFGAQGAMAFADPAFIPDPDPSDLAAIGIETAASVKKLFSIEPKVAMLSYSTMDSASGPMVDKVTQAVEIARKNAPDLMLDGPLQADSALVASVGKRKCPNSTVAGNASILVFPDLNAGNIGYKLVQRLGDAVAIGPITVGLSRAVNDLSRGCTPEEVLDVIAITAVQAS